MSWDKLKNWAVSLIKFNHEKQSLLTVELKNLTTKQRKKIPTVLLQLSCQLFFKQLKNSLLCYFPEEKLFNPVQVDDGSKYVMFHKLNLCIKIKKIITAYNKSLSHLFSSAIGLSKFVYF